MEKEAENSPFILKKVTSHVIFTLIGLFKNPFAETRTVAIWFERHLPRPLISLSKALLWTLVFCLGPTAKLVVVTGSPMLMDPSRPDVRLHYMYIGR